MKAPALGLALLSALGLAGCNSLSMDVGHVGSVEQAAPAPTSPRSLETMTFARPQWRVGDQWRYSDDYALRVSEVNGPLTRFDRQDASGQWFLSNGFFRERSQSSTSARQVVFRSEDPDRFYSQPAGEPVVFVREYLKDKQLVRHQTSWVVEGRERITVPAGTFDTFVIVMRTRSLTSNWTGYERWWYAPAVRNYVRMEYKYGQSPENARVLLNYSLGG